MEGVGAGSRECVRLFEILLVGFSYAAVVSHIDVGTVLLL